MDGIQFNKLIYTASKSLKYPALKFARRKGSEMNNLIQEILLKGVKYQSSFTNLQLKDFFYRFLGLGTGHEPNTFSCYERKSDIFPVENIYETLSQMDQTFKEPFMMHFSGLKMEDIAEKLNLPVENVKNKIEAARLILTMR